MTDVGKMPCFIILMPNSAAKHGKIVCFAALLRDSRLTIWIGRKLPTAISLYRRMTKHIK
jgi:hypothetical protein